MWQGIRTQIWKIARPLASFLPARLVCSVFSEEVIVRQSGLFDADWYLALNPDVRRAGSDPVRHYLNFGAHECRDPNPDFDTVRYLEDNPDLEATGLNPLVHHILTGGPDSNLPERKHKTGSSHRQAGEPRSQANPPRTASAEQSAHSPGPFQQMVSPKDGPAFAQLPREAAACARDILAVAPQRISVIVASWNRAEILPRAIDSIFAQSYPALEVIVSDDGSTDQTVSLLQQRYAEDLDSGRLKLLENPHRGVSAARNTALQAAAGDLIAYLDSDNTWRPDYLLTAAAVFAENVALDSAYAAMEVHEAGGEAATVRSQQFDRRSLLDVNFVDLNVFAHRRKLYERHGGFWDELTRFVDWELIIRYTAEQAPAHIQYIGADYYLDRSRLKNISFTVSQTRNKLKIFERHADERARLGLSGGT